MALLQISEPGQAPDPHQRRIAVGIDLGTTHSLVASVRNGVAECLPDDKGQVILPSVVRYLPGQGRQIGQEAVVNAAQDPENTLASVKRFMGRSLSDIAHPEKLPYKFVKPDGASVKGMLSIQTVQGEKSPVEVSAEILATLRYRAEDTFNDDLHGAVITVPAYFDDAQRQATKDAAQMAGIKVRREPISNAELGELINSVLWLDHTAEASDVQRSGLVPPRKYSDATLQQVANSPNQVLCECPRHVAELISQLASFEQYSQECLNKSAEDAHLHAYLSSVSGSARALFEKALEMVAQHENITLPQIPSWGAKSS
jgi:hypothetical protein